MSNLASLHAKIYNPTTLALIGTIDTVVSATGQHHESRVGSGSFSMPAYDSTGRGYISIGRIAYIVATSNASGGGDIEIAVFRIEKMSTRITDGLTYFDVSGPDILQELAHQSIGYDVISDGAGGPDTDDVTNVVAYHSGWSAQFLPTGSDTGTDDGTYLVGAGESVLDALRQIQAQAGDHFRRKLWPDIRTLQWLKSPVASTVTLVLPNTSADAYNTTAYGLLTGFDEDEDGADMVTRVYCYGAGLGDGRLTMLSLDTAASPPSPPAGYSVDFIASLITNTALEAVSGQPVIERYQQFGNIKPEDETVTADVETAATQLFYAGLKFLQERDAAEVFYNVSAVVHAAIRPVDYVHITFSDTAAGLTVDADFFVHEARYTVGDNGIRVNLKLSLADRRQLADVDFVAQKLNQHETTLRHANAGAGAGTPTTPLTLSVSTTNTSSAAGHTHAITSSSAPGAAASILATAPTTGAVTIKKVTVDAPPGATTYALGVNFSASSGTPYGADMQVTATAALSEATGYRGIAKGTHSSGNIPVLVGFVGEARLDGAGTAGNLIGCDSRLAITSSGGATNGYGYLMTVPVDTGAGAYTNIFGLYLPDITQATNNFAIITNAGSIVFNEGGDASTYLRVEGDTDANLIRTDPANDAVGIGLNSPAAKLHVHHPTIGSAVFETTSAADDSDPTEIVYQNKVLTTNATETTIHTFVLPASTTYGIEAVVTARRTGGAAGAAEDGAFFYLFAAFKNVAGTATAIGSATRVAKRDQAAWDANLDTSGGNVRCRVTGAASNNVSWAMTAKVYPVST